MEDRAFRIKRGEKVMVLFPNERRWWGWRRKVKRGAGCDVTDSYCPPELVT